MIKPRKTIEDIIPYETDYYPIDWEMKLDSNENIYGINSIVENAIKNIDFKKISLYPSYGNLIDKISKRYNVKQNNILLSNGCDEALSIIINTFIDEGDEILSFTPSFSMPLLYAKTMGAKIKKIDYDEKFVFNYEKFDKNISTNTKIAYIATPNNPTGEVAPASAVEKLLKTHTDTLFIIDCTYINFSFSVDFLEYLNLIKYDNAVVIKSFSKDFALAGLRLGFMVSDEKNIENLKKVASPYNVNVVALECANAVLDNENYFLNVKNDNKKTLDMVYDALKELNYEPYKSEANFILCDFKNHVDFIYQKLKNNGIIVRKYPENSELATYLRITMPKINKVDELISLLKPRPLYVFDMDGVIFDVSNSYRQAIIKTYEHFSNETITVSDIQKVKNLGGMSNDWKVTEFLLEKIGKNPGYDKVVEVFQKLFFDEEKPKQERGLINFERLVLTKEFFESVNKFADCVLFTSRERKEAFYSMEKDDIKKYFSYFICMENVGEKTKPNPLGLNIIKEKCPYTKIFYFGDTIDDIKAGVDANVAAYGIIPPNAVNIDETIAKLKEFGAKGVFKNPKEILEAELYKKEVVYQ